MKKVLSSIMVLCMIFSIVFGNTTLGYAKIKQAPKYSLKEAIESAKKTFNLSTNGYEFKSNYNEYNDTKSWELNWYPKNEIGTSTSITVNADTCEILSMNRYDFNNESVPKIPKYSKADALKVAQNFIKKIHPEIMKNLVLKEDSTRYYNNSLTYDFYFVRTINGVEFQDNGINISLDKNTLILRAYNYNWNQKNLPDISKAMSLDKAKKIFEDKIGLQLSYNLIYNSSLKQPKAILVYTLKNTEKPIDAITGELINTRYYPMFRSTSKENSVNVNDSILSPKEKEVVENNSKYISQDKAIEIIKQDTNIKLTKDYKLTNTRLYSYEYPDNSALWSLNWSYNDNANEINNYISATVDAITGEIKAFSQYGSDFETNKDQKTKFSKDAAKNIAEAYLKQAQKEKFNMCKLVENSNMYAIYSDSPSVYYFNYVQEYKNATCPFNSFNVAVDAYTGQITNYSYNWLDIELPSQEGIIDLPRAYKTLYDKSKFTLKYLELSDFRSSNSSPEIRLAYSIDNLYGYIDAKTASMVDYEGKPIKDKVKASFSDIKGTKYETSINLLIDMNVLEVDNTKFMPNNNILQKDFVKMLARSIDTEYYYIPSDNTNEYDKYYNILLGKKIISQKEISQNSYVTKQQAAKMIVRALGVGLVADIGDLYISPFKDSKSINNSYKGYCTIANRLNIITADEGNFNPNSKITRGGCAQIIINYMKINPDPNNR